MNKIISSILIFEYHIIAAFLFVLIIIYFGIDAFIEVFPTIIFFAFWLILVDAHRKDFKKKLSSITLDQKKIHDIANAEFRKSYFLEILVLAVVNYIIMAFKHPFPPIDFICFFIIGIFALLGYFISKQGKAESLVPVFGIISASLIIGESAYLLDPHRNGTSLFFFTLVSSIVIDFAYLVKHYVCKHKSVSKTDDLILISIMNDDLSGIEHVRQMAKLNLSDECYKAYLTLIEPGIRSIITNYMRSWQDIESVVTCMVMVHKKVYKTDIQFISLPPDAKDKFGDQVDINGFNKIKFGMSFKDKIDYLKNVGTLQKNSYNLLNMLNKRRNMIHEIGGVFSQRDLNIFALAYSVVFYLLMTMTKAGFGSLEMNVKVMNDIEIWSSNLIYEIEATTS